MSKVFKVKDIIENPIRAFEEFHIRLQKIGQMAPFPEFKETVDFLIENLKSEYVEKVLLNNPVLKLELEEVLTFLHHLNLSFKVDEKIDYPYLIPYDQPYPYRPTIDAIEAAIRFLDKVNRLDPENKALRLYHFDRYCYHRHSLITNENVILFPTIQELSLIDFIKTRCVPIEFVGVIGKTVRVDGHQQSPLDFWYHDMNHARRLFAYILRKLKIHNRDVEMEKYQYYKEMNNFTEEVILKKICHIDKNMSEYEQAIRKISILIIFEIIHETALTIERDEIIKDLMRRTGPQPFEFMSKEENKDYEELRTPTGNLKSGAGHFKEDVGKVTHVRYFFDPTSIGLLANIYSKINHYYYDDENVVFEHMVPSEYRTPEMVVAAAKHILAALDYSDIPSDSVLMDMVLNRAGTKEKSFSKPINEAGENLSQFATDPLKANELIGLIQDLKKQTGKKVFTIFGYAALSYENYDELFDCVKQELVMLDPKEWLICIGATEDGIGRVYKLASEMGFETIGIVSVVALSYNGKFSDYVNKIYIANDVHWGGRLPGTNDLSQTAKVNLEITDKFCAFGGGGITGVIMEEFVKRGISIKFYDLDMNHKIAESKGLSSFKGQAAKIWQSLNSK